MKIWLMTIGSAGDVHPFVGLGLELKRRGHEVTVITTDYFGEEIKRAGLEFQPFVLPQNFIDVIDHPDLWHPIRGFKLLYQNIFVPLAETSYQMIAQHYRPGEMGVVASSLLFGARMAEEKLGVPVATVHLQPVVLRSVYDTPVFPGLRLGPAVPRWLKRLIFRVMDRYVDRIICPELNRHRKNIGLRPVKRIFENWIHSPNLVIGLFPEWFASPQPDWPPHAHATGFPLFDAGRAYPLPDAVRQFLAEGEAPIVFTAGSANKQGRWFFEAAVAACKSLNCRALLLNRFPEQIPTDLPPNIFFAEYAPFSDVFPKSRLVVHHGGVGTTAQVVAAGVPQLIVPISFDQPDQAMRIERSSLGGQIPLAKFKEPYLSAAIRDLLNNTRIAEQAHQMAQRINGQEAINLSCDLIEQAFRKSILKA